ncbi:MAG: hypothetical protein VW258_11475 [Thalassolituus sp.]
MSKQILFRDPSTNDAVITLGTDTEVEVDCQLQYCQLFVALRCYDDAAALDANEAAPSGLTFTVLGRLKFAIEDEAYYWRTLDNGSGVSSSIINNQDRLEPAGLGHADRVKIVFNGDWSGYYARGLLLTSNN